MTDTATALVSATADAFVPAAELPSWVVPATPQPTYTTVGINKDGELYIYGETAATPGPVLPAIIGVVLDAQVNQYGAASRYGARDYLDLYLGTPVPGDVIVLRLPCGAKPHPETTLLQTPWSVRSLLAALLSVDLRETAVKLQPRRGTATTFFQVFPHSSAGVEQPELRAEPLGPSQDDLEIAVNRLRQSLDLPPQFPNYVNERPATA